jgi:hypothetical protein
MIFGAVNSLRAIARKPAQRLSRMPMPATIR